MSDALKAVRSACNEVSRSQGGGGGSQSAPLPAAKAGAADNDRNLEPDSNLYESRSGGYWL